MARKNSTRERHTAHFPAFEQDTPAPHALVPFKALLKRLSEAYGPSGSEDGVRALVRNEIKAHVDQMRVDAMGNLIAQRRGSGAARKKIMLSAHLDEIGVMLTFIDARGFARFGALGAVKPLTLLGARVQFENGVRGVIGRGGKNTARTEIDESALFIDVGAASAENAPVRVGDTACVTREFVDNGDFLIGKALDGRAGCAVLIETLRHLKKSPHELYFVFTAQNQVGARGAGAAAFSIQPDLAIVLNATAAQDIPDARANGIALGQGPAIKFQDEGALTSASARQLLMQAARDAHLPYQLDVTPSAHGDGLFAQAAREGVPTGVLGIPVRYRHTPSETIHYQDVERAVTLLQNLLSKTISLP